MGSFFLNGKFTCSFYFQEGLQTHHGLFPTNTGVMRCLAQSLRGSTTTKRASVSTTRPNRLHTHTHSPKRLAHPRSPMPPPSALTARATHARPLLPAVLVLVPYGFVLVRVRVSAGQLRGAWKVRNNQSYRTGTRTSTSAARAESRPGFYR